MLCRANVGFEGSRSARNHHGTKSTEEILRMIFYSSEASSFHEVFQANHIQYKLVRSVLSIPLPRYLLNSITDDIYLYKRIQERTTICNTKTTAPWMGPAAQTVLQCMWKWFRRNQACLNNTNHDYHNR